MQVAEGLRLAPQARLAYVTSAVSSGLFLGYAALKPREIENGIRRISELL
jgi:DNA-binding transcriptional MocR family regulator